MGVGGQFLWGKGLADPCLPHQHIQPATTGQRLFQCRPELTQFPLAADESTAGRDGLVA